MFRTLLTASALMIPAAAALAAEDSIDHFRYACADDGVLEVIYVNTAAGQSWAIVNQMDEMVPMQIVPMASGASYKAIDPDYSYELHTKGDWAELTDPDGPLLADCTLSE